MSERGSTTAEYVGIVIVVVVVVLGLVAVRSTTLGRRAPVRPLPAILGMLEAPLRPIVPARPAAPVRPRASGPARPRPTSAAPPAVLLPPWAAEGR